jgi:hypothetical protein
VTAFTKQAAVHITLPLIVPGGANGLRAIVWTFGKIALLAITLSFSGDQPCVLIPESPLLMTVL